MTLKVTFYIVVNSIFINLRKWLEANFVQNEIQLYPQFTELTEGENKNRLLNLTSDFEI